MKSASWFGGWAGHGQVRAGKGSGVALASMPKTCQEDSAVNEALREFLDTVYGAAPPTPEP